MQKTWIVVADSARARIYEHQGRNHPLKSVDELTHSHEKSQDLVTTKRGRMPDTGSGHRSALDRPTDPHEHEKHVFAQELKHYLKKHVDAVDRLILAAAPKMLGDLRQQLPNTVKTKISAELDKDLTNIPAPELPKHLQSVLNINPKPRPKEF